VVNAKVLLTTTFIASTVFAQGPAPAPIAPPSAGAPADVSVKQRPTLTPEEMVNQSRDYAKTMNEVLKRIQVLQDQAKRAKDIIRLNCVTDKVVQVRVNISIAEQSIA